MGEVKQERPASYSTTDEQETLAISTFRYLTDHKKVKLDLKERDKYPNIDGYIELVDEFRAPIAKLEVQIRKLPDDQLKLKCPINLLNYTERTCNPVLFIGVDTRNRRAYWIHVNKQLFADSIKSQQKTKVVSFPVENVIDGENTSYISEWISIAEIYQIRIRDFPIMEHTLTELSKKSNHILGIERKDFEEIHLFLDEFNALLDGDFFAVKKVFYPNSWKIGLAYYDYKDTNISYSLYPIPIWQNDVQIKEIIGPLRKQTMNQLGVIAHYIENPIKLRPKEYAVNIVESKMLKVLENRLLSHEGSEFLAEEFVFAFIEKFSQQLGVERKEQYALSDIEAGFFNFLPLWTHEAMKFLVNIQRNRIRSLGQLLYRRPYFNPDMLIMQISDEERIKIDQTVRKRIDRNDNVPSMPLGNDRFPFRAFVEFLSFLKSKGIKKICRVYLPKDFSRLKQGTGWVWNVFSPDAVETNLNIFFEHLPEVYNGIVSYNFPRIKEKLRIFGDASKTIVTFNVKDSYKEHQDAPSFQLFHLKAEESTSYEITVYKKGDDALPTNLSWDYLGRDLDIDGRNYKLISGCSSILDFIYDDLPMFNFFYDLLTDNIKGYFNSLRQPR